MTSTLTGFTRDVIAPIGVVTLPVTFGNEPRIKTLMVPFMVVKLPSAYNVIIDRPTLNKLRAIISTYHCNIKFLTNARAGEVRSDPRDLVFATEAVLPPKVVYPTLRIEHFTPGASKVGLRENLDFTEEHRAKAHLRILHYQRVVARLYNRKI
ncbi:hypothetical protein BHM03_00030687 [Ensete ventricosum]|nr:hypothetical protein BHM03_00030687 [Ensete ventricosum]